MDGLSNNLYSTIRVDFYGTFKTNTRSRNGSSGLIIMILVSVLLIGFFLLEFDQSHLFSVVQGSDAFDIILIPEFTHDIRHAVGFPFQ